MTFLGFCGWFAFGMFIGLPATGIIASAICSRSNSRNKIRSIEKENRSLTYAVNQKQSSIDDLSRKNLQLQNDLKATRIDLESAKQKSLDAQNWITKYSNAREKLIAVDRKQKEERKELDAIRSVLQGERNSFTIECNKKRSELETECNAKRADIDREFERLAQMEKDCLVKADEQSIVSYTNRIKVLEDKNKKDRDNYNKELASKNVRISTLLCENNRLSNEKTKVDSAQNQKIKSLEYTIAQLRKQIINNEAKIKSNASELDRIDDMENEIALLRQRLSCATQCSVQKFRYNKILSDLERGITPGLNMNQVEYAKYLREEFPRLKEKDKTYIYGIEIANGFKIGITVNPETRWDDHYKCADTRYSYIAGPFERELCYQYEAEMKKNFNAISDSKSSETFPKSQKEGIIKKALEWLRKQEQVIK